MKKVFEHSKESERERDSRKQKVTAQTRNPNDCLSLCSLCPLVNLDFDSFLTDFFYMPFQMFFLFFLFMTINTFLLILISKKKPKNCHLLFKVTIKT